MNRHIAGYVTLTIALVMNASALQPATGEKETGLAAVYSDALNGHITASGQTFDQSKLTAAHKTLPFGTKIKVTNTKNSHSVIVRVNDRGPVQSGRILDLSQAAAARLHIPKNSMREVSVDVLALGSGKTVKQAAK
ncbi:septal ring lytic transglycosylase RlpA family protein [Occallatibacter savannae]|uniref:septal ring lytic transglycosylase RlpA family protein n=1 Tax=Occallatibacter savannae TaxID=1002691 RepID=UPI000D69B293|nr:septal ring lytic transglycosylase RlpA family protein [Occallatibacter savannae]